MITHVQLFNSTRFFSRKCASRILILKQGWVSIPGGDSCSVRPLTFIKLPLTLSLPHMSLWRIIFLVWTNYTNDYIEMTSLIGSRVYEGDISHLFWSLDLEFEKENKLTYSRILIYSIIWQLTEIALFPLTAIKKKELIAPFYRCSWNLKLQRQYKHWTTLRVYYTICTLKLQPPNQQTVLPLMLNIIFQVLKLFINIRGRCSLVKTNSYWKDSGLHILSDRILNKMPRKF